MRRVVSPPSAAGRRRWRGLADGERLLVCQAAHGPYPGCFVGPAVSIVGDENPSTLHVVAATGPANDRVVARGSIVFADWEPRGRGFAWADYAGLHFSDGRNQRVYSSGGEWAGWSPNGRFLAQGPEDGYAVIDVVTGKRDRVVRKQNSVDEVVRWWHP